MSRPLATAFRLLAVSAVLTFGVPASPAAAAESSSVSAAQAQRVYFAANCINPRYRPLNIVVACADAGFQIRGVVWSQWTSRLANGSGLARVNDCVPNCAAGTFHSYPVLATLSSPRFCRNSGRVQFQRLTLFFSAQRPPGYAGRTTYAPGCGLDRD